MKGNRGFTIIELLITIAIIGILASVVMSSISHAKQKAYYNRSLAEFKNINTALELYMDDHDREFPSDVGRNTPSGLEAYLSGGVWPTAPWPGSYYDWDNWPDPSDPDNTRIYQISIRFCTSGSNPVCTFPNTDWAEGFEVNSALYYCVEGSCRAHVNEAIDYPGYCVNCQN